VNDDQRPLVIDRRVTSRGDVVLRRAGDAFEVIANGTFLMDTRDGRSERALVAAALEGMTRPRLLLGGLGVGFSLDEALRRDVAEVVVVEVEPAVLEWAAGPLRGVVEHGLDDPRVRPVIADLREVLAELEPPFDAVCLDVDNGPGWLVHEDNAALYGREGLAAVARLLRPGGRLSVWSAQPDEEFEARLRQLFGRVETIHIPVARGPDDVVYLSRTRRP
jgi:spermidine synthase